MALAPTPVHRRHVPHGWRIVEAAAFALLVAAVVVLALHATGSSRSALQGSGIAATQARSVPTFTGVELAGAASVAVTVGARQRVVVHADDNLLDHVTTRVVAGRLVVGTTGSYTTEAPMSVEVAVPQLASLALTGSGILGAANLRGKTLTATLSGSGILRATGAVERLHVSLGGSGDAELGGLVARDASVVLTGAGRVVVDTTASLDATIAGSGSIVYTGSPARVTTHVTGSGAVIPG